LNSELRAEQSECISFTPDFCVEETVREWEIILRMTAGIGILLDGDCG